VKAELESGFISAVSGQNDIIFVGEDWIRPAEAPNTVGDLTDLLFRMCSAVPLVAIELANGAEFNLTRGRHRRPPRKRVEATRFINSGIKSATLILVELWQSNSKCGTRSDALIHSPRAPPWDSNPAFCERVGNFLVGNAQLRIVNFNISLDHL